MDTSIPIPDYLMDLEKDISNFGLIFQKFFPYVTEQLETSTMVNRMSVNSVDKLAEKWKLNINSKKISNFIKEKQTQQNRLLEQKCTLSADIIKINATLSSRLITGTGETTPVEVGMKFDRNMGIPYIPASSIKGVVAYAYCVNYINQHQEDNTSFDTTEKGFTDLFGSRDGNDPKRGGFCFLDAYPVTSPKIVVDIMNPHFGKYYEGKQPPSETDNPVPIKFLSVEKGLKFEFKGFFISTNKKDIDKLKNDLIKAFKTALGTIGIGAKTATGYGLFDTIEDQSKDLKIEISKKQEKEERNKEEKRRQKQENIILERKRAEKLAEQKQKEKSEKEYQAKIASAEGIEKDILLLEKENISLAWQCYEKYLKNKEELTEENDIKIAELFKRNLVKVPKKNMRKMNKNKKQKIHHVNKLLSPLSRQQ